MADPVAYINRAELENRFSAQEIAQLLDEPFPHDFTAPTIVASIKATGASPLSGDLHVSEGDLLIAFVRVTEYAFAHGVEIADTQVNNWRELGVSFTGVGLPAIIAFVTTASESGFNRVAASRLLASLSLVVLELTGSNEQNVAFYPDAAVNGEPAVDLGTLPAEHLVIGAALSLTTVDLAADTGFTDVDSYGTGGVLSVIAESDPIAGPVELAWTGSGPWIALGIDVTPAIEGRFPDTARKLERAIYDATALVDGYLATRYDLPLRFAPTIVIGWAADIARFRMWKDRAPEEVRTRYDDAISQLKDLAASRLSLPPSALNAEEAPLYLQKFTSIGSDRVFTADTLAGY